MQKYFLFPLQNQPHKYTKKFLVKKIRFFRKTKNCIFAGHKLFHTFYITTIFVVSFLLYKILFYHKFVSKKRSIMQKKQSICAMTIFICADKSHFLVFFLMFTIFAVRFTYINVYTYFFPIISNILFIKTYQ